MSETIEMVKLADIRIDGGTQPRTNLDENIIEEYSHYLSDLPPVKLMYDGSAFWLWDGFHRYFAHKAKDVAQIRASIDPGTRREAILASLGANNSHGLRRSNADKKKAIETIWADAEWALRPVSWLSEKCNVSPALINKYRPKEKSLNTILSDSTLDDDTKKKVREIKKAGGVPRVGVNKHGDTQVMNVAKIGKATKPEPVVVEPEDVEPTMPWADFEAGIREVQKHLRSAVGVLRGTLEYDAESKNLKSKWAAFYSAQGTIGSINQLVRELDNGLPVELCADKPGYRNARNAAIAKRTAA